MTTYRDALFFREPKELAVFRQFFACTRPRTVIELGTFTGSSAVWFADTAALYGLSLFHGTAWHIPEHFSTLFSGTEQLFITLVCM